METTMTQGSVLPGSVSGVSVADQRPITIRGGGQSPAEVVIDCQARGPVVDGTVDGPTHIRLENMHFRSAQRSGGGGALLSAGRGARIVLDRCLVSDCGTDGDGGAIALSDSDLDIRGSHFQRLRAEINGGALALVDRARVTMADSTFTDCSAGNFGGAAFVSSGSTCVMDRVVFAFNEAVLKGGGVFAGDASHVNASASEWRNNTSMRGGGVN